MNRSVLLGAGAAIVAFIGSITYSAFIIEDSPILIATTAVVVAFLNGTLFGLLDLFYRLLSVKEGAS